MSESRKLSRLDLNLLLALDALLTDRSVTRAADRLGVSQPAMSASLARIRRQFEDPILIRRGNGFDVSPLAARLAPHAAIALDAARRVFESQADWSPAESTREFSFYSSDFGMRTIGPVVSRLVEESAPGVRLRLSLLSPAIVDEAKMRLRTIDGMILPHGFLEGLSHTDLWHDDWVVLADEANEVIAEGMALDALRECRWVYSYQSKQAFTLATRQLQNLGIEPDVAAVVESFLAIPDFLIGTRRIALVQRRVAERAIRSGGLRMVKAPFEPSPVLTALWWHPLFDADPEHRWIRETFARAGAKVESATSL
ncbi:LysR family transcriptional regulator [Cryobacterium sp. AP23]